MRCMKAVAVLAVYTCVGMHGAQLYVALNGASIAPYDTWAKAASNIQMAVSAAAVGDTVWVTNGVYRGGGAHFGTAVFSNRVQVIGAITVRSVNGPAVTIIEGQAGAGGGCGTGAVRCVYLRDGAALVGFTLSNGYTSVGGMEYETWGGGVYAYGAHVENCIITECTANNYGGGAALSRSSLRDTEVNGTRVVQYSAAGIQASDQSLVSNCYVHKIESGEAGALTVNRSTALACRVECNAGAGIVGAYDAVITECRSARNRGRGFYLLNECLMQRCVSVGNVAACIWRRIPTL